MSISDMIAQAKKYQQDSLFLADYYSFFGLYDFLESCAKHNIKPIAGIRIRLQDSASDLISNVIVVLLSRSSYYDFVKLYNSLSLKRRSVDIVFTMTDLSTISNICLIIGSTDSIIEHMYRANSSIESSEYQFLSSIRTNFKTFIGISDIDSYFQEIASYLKSFIDIKEFILVYDCFLESEDDFLSICLLRAIEKKMKFADIISSNVDICRKSQSWTNANFYLDYDCNNCIYTDNVKWIEQNTTLSINDLKYNPLQTLPVIEDSADIIRTLTSHALNEYCRNNSIDVQKYQKRLDYELDLIHRFNLDGYFYIVYDIIKWCRDNDIAYGYGRGSAAGSLVCMLLGITKIDPILHDLIFERFINEDRTNIPDIDIDICQINRGRVIEYVQKRYGIRYVAHIITYTKMQFRVAFKDVARVLDNGLYIPEIEALIDSIDEIDAMSERLSIIENEVRLGQYESVRTYFISVFASNSDKSIIDRILNKKINAVRVCLEHTHRIISCLRDTSVHTAGLIISAIDLHDNLLLYCAEQDRHSTHTVTSHYDLNFLEKMGFVKFDLLGLETLSIVDRIMKLGNIQCNIRNILNLPELYSHRNILFLRGIFQLDRSGAHNTINRMQPRSFDDLTAFSALNRPGPKAYIPIYIARLADKKRSYLRTINPLLVSITESTYGIVIYQEQIMNLVKESADFSLREADHFRVAIAKKKKDLLDEQLEIFRKRAMSKNIPEEQISDLIKILLPFGDYAFNKAHAVAYTYLTVLTIYLKYIDPLLFSIVNMDFHRSSFRKINLFLSEISISLRGRYVILPPCLDGPYDHYIQHFSTELAYLRLPLSHIEGIGEANIESIRKVRHRTLFNKIKASKLTTANMRTLSHYSCFDLDTADSLNYNRARKTNAAAVFLAAYDQRIDYSTLIERLYLSLNTEYRLYALNLSNFIVRLIDTAYVSARPFYWVENVDKGLCQLRNLESKYITYLTSEDIRKFEILYLPPSKLALHRTSSSYVNLTGRAIKLRSLSGIHPDFNEMLDSVRLLICVVDNNIMKYINPDNSSRIYYRLRREKISIISASLRTIRIDALILFLLKQKLTVHLYRKDLDS